MMASPTSRDGTSQQLAKLVASLEHLAAEAAYAGETCAPVLLHVAELLKVAIPAPVAAPADLSMLIATET